MTEGPVSRGEAEKTGGVGKKGEYSQTSLASRAPLGQSFCNRTARTFAFALGLHPIRQTPLTFAVTGSDDKGPRLGE